MGRPLPVPRGAQLVGGPRDGALVAHPVGSMLICIEQTSRVRWVADPGELPPPPSYSEARYFPERRRVCWDAEVTRVYVRAEQRVVR